ncbi:MAG: aminopeptidase [candidate division KSB1 bacterium]|nr:aminopeptidase [candidate division KSB1 bacterium]MDZ7378893.1 aminopeptidase [candidate division KSB1 bacterium]MDZ7385247.1 aminopeptidase [candidate division KSB1 bacterium]MDZ7393455.1 aminopeptidase [candidate division KSB1 bacterium]MDZ7414179.1 aminopeptidase [candidate division KSB1 bacterium]
MLTDPRLEKLANVIVTHSTRLRRGDKLLIEAVDVPDEAVLAIARRATRAGAEVFVLTKHGVILRELCRQATEESMRLMGQVEAALMEQMDAYVALRGSHNVAELSDVPPDKMQLYQTHWWKPVHLQIRVPRTRWVVLRWPHPAMAQQAHMSTEAFADYFFTVCTLDYRRLSRAMEPLRERMLHTDMVEIKGPGTALRFSIKGMPAVKCDGRRNLPDGELFTAPVRDSINGTIRFNTTSVFQGVRFEGITLRFRHGRIVDARADKTERLNQILDSDEGARYTGEFSFGLNPYITKPMQDTLFDEKIAGSFHLTPGSAYEQADNGNRSQVHWDMVMMQTPEYGGGEIYFDGTLIRKDGLFVPEDLHQLNPDRLLHSGR